MSFASVSRYRKIDKTTWAFVTIATIAMDGRLSFSELLQKKEGKNAFVPDIGIVYEMAHYYFGTRFVPRGPLQWFLLESTAEFLAIKAHRTLSGEDAYTAVVRNHYKEAVALGQIVSLDKIQQAEQIGQNYRYRVGPLLLIALEQYTNERIVQKTLAELITNPPVGEVSYLDFRERLKSAGAIC